jgi:hypothetical protein
VDGETGWRVAGFPGWRGGRDLTLVIDTTDEDVVSMIEQAAANAGIDLARVNLALEEWAEST